MRVIAGLILTATILAFAIPVADAHFKLISPQGWIVEADNGDPQKLGPCGGTTANGGTPSNIVNQVQGGQKLHLKLMETVFHPGHYRVALAVNSRAELPMDPEVTTTQGARGPQSVSAVIQNPPVIPVLADGLWVHTTRATEPWETDIDIPNINCPKCTLQIIEFMAQHGLNPDGGYIYHHCADVKITADASKPIDKRWPAVK